ncbi:HepT-like ribonuclease domain-containing protein [uncultured Duncaniella sp.]|uniref:HepT-like ribonuclease domain-containing protein n=1 Tax=uncultured Duncaniella sp. TaxID=2768039 RepID=UPI00262EBFFC|nr:HepT-like ribonuclease domain-containing protein [uncultured Duncaniella sp.]
MEYSVSKTLNDILCAIEEIELFFQTRPRRFDVYMSDICLKRAVERNITIIGEAMNRLLKTVPEIDITAARRIVDTRNYVIHGYDSVTDEILWGIVVRHLPVLKEEVMRLLNQ